MRTASKHMLSGAIGLALAWCAAWAFSPERQLPSKKLVLLVGEGCPRSLELQRQVREDPELASRVLTLSIDLEGEMLGCDRVADDVVEQAPWLRYFDRGWICRRLNHHAAALHREHFVGLPAWLDRGAPVAPQEVRSALERHGLGSCPGPVLHVGEASCPEAGPGEGPGVMMLDAVERGTDIGF